MIWHNYRRCSLMYRRTTSSLTLPQPFRQNTHPPKSYLPTKTPRAPDTLFLSPETGSPFEPLHHFSHTVAWLRLDDNMYVVLFDTQLTDPPLIHPACFPQQLPQADDHFASQYSPTILRYPHQVVLQTVFGMGPSLVSGHSQIMSEFAPLRQVPPGYASKGCHSSPG